MREKSLWVCKQHLEQSSLYFQNADKLFEIKTDRNCSSQNLTCIDMW